MDYQEDGGAVEVTRPNCQSLVAVPKPNVASGSGQRVDFCVFRLATFETWESLFGRAAAFASELAPESVISISHSGGKHTEAYAVTVWFWTN